MKFFSKRQKVFSQRRRAHREILELLVLKTEKILFFSAYSACSARDAFRFRYVPLAGFVRVRRFP
jgi:L-amino acid N-acyltransferase YncA